MNRKIFIALCLSIAITACNKDKSEVAPKAQTTGNSAPRYANRDSGASSLFIPMDVANQMIGSYVQSLGSSQNALGDNLKAFSVNADSLRAYLADTSIKNIKLIFAHTTEYISAGNTNKFSGLQSGAMTIIVAGYDASGNYIYLGGKVLDHAAPCPYTCPPGSAGADLLQ
jgi:hypothetical protein